MSKVIWTPWALAALLLAPTLAWGQQLGVSVSLAHSRTPPLSRSPLDRQLGLTLGIAWRPAARVGAELQLEHTEGPHIVRNYIDAMRTSVTLSVTWRNQFGPLGVTLLPGIGASRLTLPFEDTRFPWERDFFVDANPHASLGARIDLRPLSWLRLFAEASSSYLLLSSESERRIAEWPPWRAPGEPRCDLSSTCIAPFRDAWTTTGRMGLMLLAF